MKEEGGEREEEEGEEKEEKDESTLGSPLKISEGKKQVRTSLETYAKIVFMLTETRGL